MFDFDFDFDFGPAHEASFKPVFGPNPKPEVIGVLDTVETEGGVFLDICLMSDGSVQTIEAVAIEVEDGDLRSPHF